MQTSAGRRFGYQVTFFRVGVDPAPANPSAWAVRDLFMAHLAVSDPASDRYRFDEKLTRGGPGLSGAATDTYKVWNEDWTAQPRRSGPPCDLGDRAGRPAWNWCWPRARARSSTA